MQSEERNAIWLRLMEQYRGALGRLAQSYEFDAGAREDLLQEIGLGIWKAIPAFRGEASERTWLYRIAHNVAITATVKRRRRESREVAPEQARDGPPAGATAERHLLEDERRGMLLAAVRGLPPPDRQITLLHLEGLTGAEIAEVAGLAEGAVATRLTRIREKLRKAIRAREVGDGR